MTDPTTNVLIDCGLSDKAYMNRRALKRAPYIYMYRQCLYFRLGINLIQLCYRNVFTFGYVFHSTSSTS